MPTGVYKNRSNKEVHLGQKVSKRRRLLASLALKNIPKSDEHRRKIIENIPRGENHYRWIKDRSKISKNRGDDVQGKRWMFIIKRRDNWKCKLRNRYCSGRMEAHHILGWTEYPKFRYVISNGITLCHYHHPRTRKKELEMVRLFKKLIK